MLSTVEWTPLCWRTSSSARWKPNVSVCQIKCCSSPYACLTAPADWLESLVKAYVGDGIARDFYREVAAYMDPRSGGLVREVLADMGQAAFAVDRVRGAIDANPAVGGRLALWARRLVGEALTQAQRVAVDREAIVRLLSSQAADVSELDIAFHERMLQLATSPRLSRMHQTFITETRMCIHALDETYAKSEVRDKEHRALANAIRKGDRQRTDRLLTAHMDDAVHRLIHNTAVDGAEPVGN